MKVYQNSSISEKWNQQNQVTDQIIIQQVLNLDKKKRNFISNPLRKNKTGIRFVVITKNIENDIIRMYINSNEWTAYIFSQSKDFFKFKLLSKCFKGLLNY